MLSRTLSLLAVLCAAAPVLAEPGGLTGTFTLQEGGPTDTLTVIPQDNGRFAVVRTKTCFPSGERNVLRGVGHVRRGLLLVDFTQSETLPPLPNFDPSAANPTNDATQDAPTGDAGGLVGGLEDQGPSDERQGSTSAEPTRSVISASVGKGGVNLPDDVQIIQHALAERGLLDLAGLSLGTADANLNEAIRRYQIAKVGFRRPDSRVDTNDKTIAALNGAELPPRAYVVYNSVGQDGVNAAEDVETVSRALSQGGYLDPGYSGHGSDRIMISAIRRYQVERAGFRVGDGRVDINHRTLAALNGESFAKVPDAISGPGSLPLGTGNADVPATADTLAPSETGLPTDADELDRFLKSLFPAVPAGESVAAYAFRADRVHGFVSTPACNQDGRWIQEHGISVTSQAK